MHREHAVPHGGAHAPSRRIPSRSKKKKKERKHCEETTKTKSNEDVFEI